MENSGEARKNVPICPFKQEIYPWGKASLYNMDVLLMVPLKWEFSKLQRGIGYLIGYYGY